jgi:hypothetical protein
MTQQTVWSVWQYFQAFVSGPSMRNYGFDLKPRHLVPPSLELKAVPYTHAYTLTPDQIKVY